MTKLPRIAVFGGPSATICNTADLVTSNQGRVRHGLPLLVGRDGQPLRHDLLRAQRLAAPVTVYIDPYSAHPLESDAGELYAPPDGWLAADGSFHRECPGEGSRPVLVAELKPDDGLYLLPYVARQVDGSAWEAATSEPLASADQSRQTFFPDPSRLYEEIDRFGLTDSGRRVDLFAAAEFDFFRAGPSGGYTRANGDTEPEVRGVDFFPYYPSHLKSDPTLATLATITNTVQSVLDAGDYQGVQWLEGSPTIEETLYWLNLLIDTHIPMVGHSAQRRNHTLSADGARNIVDGVKYLLSGASLDAHGDDEVGAVLIVDELGYAAREMVKVDARPGGYDVIGGHGGVVVDLGGRGPVRVTFRPTRRHTHTSDLRLPALPMHVDGVRADGTGATTTITVPVRDEHGLRPAGVPTVTIHKYVRYAAGAGAGFADEVELRARLEYNLRHAPLAGVVIEGMSPYGSSGSATEAALREMIFSGYPVARVGRGNTGGNASTRDPEFIVGSNLNATKARILLMAAILKLGALPVAHDPAAPTADERARTLDATRLYQQVFDTH